MSIKRLFSLFMALTLVVVVGLTVRAGIATSEVVSRSAVTLDQHERHPEVINLGLAAEQARMEYRQGEWGANTSAKVGALDQHDRHPSASLADALSTLDQFDRHPSLTSTAEQAQEATRVQRAHAADTARWEAMGKAYTPSTNAQSAQPAYGAETARWVAMGEFYIRQADEAQRARQARNADAARWAAMGKYYAKLQTKP